MYLILYYIIFIIIIIIIILCINFNTLLTDKVGTLHEGQAGFRIMRMEGYIAKNSIFLGHSETYDTVLVYDKGYAINM